jgi:phosphoribosylaminoimidazole-succinocarboxamide synthase
MTGQGVIVAVTLRLAPEGSYMNSIATPPVFETHLRGLPLIHRGKVRDVYGLSDSLMLIVTTDRLSAFDVILPDPIPRKGEVLTKISNFWFAKTAHIAANHLTSHRIEEFITDPIELALLKDRAIVVQRLRALPVEAVVRGYLIGSGWKDYQATGAVCGVPLPAGLTQADRLPEPIFTPATKAAVGDHDENVSFDTVAATIGLSRANEIRETALRLYAYAANYALSRGIIIADTKFEFGIDAQDRLILIDEALTPDSSRFWPVAHYAPGKSPPSFDKQYVRDYLETLDWNKKAPGPRLPADVIQRTGDNYLAALKLLTQT